MAGHASLTRATPLMPGTFFPFTEVIYTPIYSGSMKAGEFLRKIERLGADRGVAVVLEKRRGKGSHAYLYLARRAPR